VISELGEDPLDALDHHASLVAMPAPDPARLTSRDVIIAIASASVGWVDLLMTSGQYQHAAKPPYTPGLEYAGTVAWAGHDATIEIGDRVLVDPFLAGPRSLGASGVRWLRDVRHAPASRRCTRSPATSRSTGVQPLGNTRRRITASSRGVSRAEDRARSRCLRLGGTRSGTSRSSSSHRDRDRTLGGKLAVVAAQGADHVLVTDAPCWRAVKNHRRSRC
jgi:NADPH2:quinone reductase